MVSFNKRCVEIGPKQSSIQQICGKHNKIFNKLGPYEQNAASNVNNVMHGYMKSFDCALAKQFIQQRLTG
jgi:hypothetical protein